VDSKKEDRVATAKETISISFSSLDDMEMILKPEKNVG